MSDFGVTVCDKCGARLVIEYNVAMSNQDEFNRWLRIRDYAFCPSCADPILRALAGVLDDIKRARRA